MQGLTLWLARLEAYKSLFKEHLDEGILDGIRAAWQTGTPLGNNYFLQKIEDKLKCKVGRRGEDVLQSQRVMMKKTVKM